MVAVGCLGGRLLCPKSPLSVRAGMNSSLEAPREPTLFTFSISGALRGLIIFTGWTPVHRSPHRTHICSPSCPGREDSFLLPLNPAMQRPPSRLSGAGHSGEEGEHDGKSPFSSESMGLQGTWGPLPKLLKFRQVPRCCTFSAVQTNCHPTRDSPPVASEQPSPPLLTWCPLLPDQVDGLVLIEDPVARPLLVQELGESKW